MSLTHEYCATYGSVKLFCLFYILQNIYMQTFFIIVKIASIQSYQ